MSIRCYLLIYLLLALPYVKRTYFIYSYYTREFYVLWNCIEVIIFSSYIFPKNLSFSIPKNSLNILLAKNRLGVLHGIPKVFSILCLFAIFIALCTWKLFVTIPTLLFVRSTSLKLLAMFSDVFEEVLSIIILDSFMPLSKRYFFIEYASGYGSFAPFPPLLCKQCLYSHLNNLKPFLI